MYGGDSNAGTSEKSQKVHSTNYKVGVMLHKEIQSLNVNEKNVACSITIDQRRIATRFRNKLARSVELMKYHDKIRSRFHHAELRPNRHQDAKMHAWNQQASANIGKFEGTRNSTKEHERRFSLNDLKAHQRERKEFDLKTFTDYGALLNRPQTALESKSKLWTKRATTANERVVRAKSAPPKSWRNCEDIMRKLNSTGGGFYVANQTQRPMSRARFAEVFDSESFQKFREDEVVRQKLDVEAFVESIEPLKLVPWYPGPAPKKEEDLVAVHDKKIKERIKYPGFVTRVDSH